MTRPPFSFTCLIGLAILKSNRTHISVGEVYKYILRNFPYFKTAKSTWRNSIRHVLSLGKYFCKRSRGSVLHEEVGPCVGKGSVWSVKGAMLPSLLQHITHGAKQLLPGTAAHLQLTDLSTTAAATAAATTGCKLAEASFDHLVGLLAIHSLDDPGNHLIVNCQASSLENGFDISGAWAFLPTENGHQVGAQVLHGHGGSSSGLACRRTI